MEAANPAGLCAEVTDRYRRYLETTFHFRDRELREAFAKALRSENLTRGVYLQATPSFARTRSGSELMIELLGHRPDAGFLRAIDGDRALYWHQEQAIRLSDGGRNVVVATGTGSGKTESFLLPILLHLYRQFEEGRLGPGVRALILYPMNALANDQRDRLGEICRVLAAENPPFRPTFGQYIGHTPENKRDSWRHAEERLSRRLDGELVLRQEMREKPPHILLTNYSMLEYLLIRPADSPLFDGGNAAEWSFLVLDEAHQYRGAKGMEMGLLLRRLKQRLREGGRTGPFRCFATSATLAGGAQEREMVSHFCSVLFGEAFGEDDVVLGRTEPMPPVATGRLTPHSIRELRDALTLPLPAGREKVHALAGGLEADLPDSGELAVLAGALLMQDGNLPALLNLLPGARDFEGVAGEMFPDLPPAVRGQALTTLVDVLGRAHKPDSGAPLLSARYHFLLRSLEGAFLAFRPKRQIFLNRTDTGEGQCFEIALCRECGQHYIVGTVEAGYLREAIRDPGHPDFGATFFRPLEDDDEPSEDDEAADERGRYQLCVRCGAIGPEGNAPPCDHSDLLVLEQAEAAAEREDQVPRCSACGYSGPDPVREVIHGNDGPHAVIATTLHARLPQDRRKVLAFTDGRQEAAFFAWYLERTYQEILERKLLLETLVRTVDGEGASLRDLAPELAEVLRREEVVGAEATAREALRSAWRILYREFLTERRRLSLEGVGLARWQLQFPPWFEVPPVLREPPWGLGEEDARALTAWLLGSLRADGAVEIVASDGISLPWEELGLLLPAPQRVTPGPARGRPGVRAWDGPRRRTTRYLERLHGGEQAKEAAVHALRAIWESLRDCDDRAPTTTSRLLLDVDGGRRLNPDWWRLRPLRDGETLFRCRRCRGLQDLALGEHCSRAGCPGKVQAVAVAELEANHYRQLYSEELPGRLRAEEHTAQLDPEKAWEFQREFKAGRIHLLSSSTTFELGVDLGDLDTVFLRNVPPEAHNYVQRVGRSGRRSGQPGLAITYCRRAAHDRYHFAEPEWMLAGHTRLPRLKVSNPKIIGRHITATVLTDFFRAQPGRFQHVQALFGDPARPSLCADLRQFIKEHHRVLERRLLPIVPPAVAAEVGLENGSWADRVMGPGSRMAQAEAELASDYGAVLQLEAAASLRRDYPTAGWAKRRAQTIGGEDVLRFLSRKAIIPKYGFPVDVVELDVQRTAGGREAHGVQLERDLKLAIAEYAPTSELVANKKLWRSHGLKRVAGKEWDRWHYRRCDRHNRFERWGPEAKAPAEKCCSEMTHIHECVVPRFGFISDRKGPREPRKRPERLFSSRPHFIGLTGPSPGVLDFPASAPAVRLTKASPGQLVVICEGRRGEGFYICLDCGTGLRQRKRSHETPYDQACTGKLKSLSIGHEFDTDVVRLQFTASCPPGQEPAWTAYALAYALIAGAAEVLQVSDTDLSATVGHADCHPLPPVILYDDVPGGAGLVAALEEEAVLRGCLGAALKRVDGRCGCGETTTCYGCLRTYQNQFAHQHLQRGTARRLLEEALKRLG
ncbi:MAG TPA: hypothetical protein DEQ28_08985 [Clostridiales bacterium]|nr:hypothetical protein [Clostridiales bacterium]